MTLAPIALGQTAEATRAAARQLATEGVNNFEAGEFAAASDKLNRAFETIRAPSLGLWSARALARCGRLVQASERYLEVTRLDPRNGDEAVQRQAQLDAERERAELQPRIARLSLAVFNAQAGRELEVTLDGVVLPSPLLRAQVPVDPGEHLIEVRQGALSASQHLRVAEGARVNVSLQLMLPPGSAAPDASTPSDPTLVPPAGAHGEPPHSSASQLAPAPARSRVALWLTLGGAGAGVVVGTVTGVMAYATREPVAPHCPGNVCDPKYKSQVDKLNSLREVSSVAFALGGVSLAAAGVLWLSEPNERGDYVRANVGLGRVGVEGAF